MKGGTILTSLPALHLYTAESTVRRHARIIYAICYSTGVGLQSWDDVTESWWMFADMEIVYMFDEEAP